MGEHGRDDGADRDPGRRLPDLVREALPQRRRRDVFGVRDLARRPGVERVLDHGGVRAVFVDVPFRGRRVHYKSRLALIDGRRRVVRIDDELRLLLVLLAARLVRCCCAGER